MDEGLDYKTLWIDAERRLTGANDWAQGSEARIKELEQKVKELEALVRYWKWQAVGYGAPDFETFEVKQ